MYSHDSDRAGPVSIRLATSDDGAACAAIYGPYVERTAITFELVPPTGPEMASRIERVLARTPWLVAELDGVVRGYAYGTRHRERAAYDWTVETTVYVDQAFMRRGIGRACMVALLDVLRLQGFHLAVAGVTGPNPGSIGLHRALGFRTVGEFPAIGYKLEAWHGVEWLYLELGPRGDPGARPVPIGDLMGSPALEAALHARR